MPLPELESELRALAANMAFFGQHEARSILALTWQAALNLMGRADGDPTVMTGEVMNQEEMIASATEQNPGVLQWAMFYRMHIAYVLGDYDAAEAHSVGIIAILDSGYGGRDVSEVVFFETLTLLAQACRGKKGGRMRTARRRIRLLKKWALSAPANFLGKLYLLEAEAARCQGKTQQAVTKYMAAILNLREEGFLSEEAIANELFGRHYLHLGETASATPYIRDALRLYKLWGAAIKVEQFENEMRHLLL
jgi:tetratricopeptide (TPR) repeat protein